jgi:hypothetical protein
MGEVDGLSFLFVNLNVAALTPRLHCGETVLELSKDMTLFAISAIQVRIIGKQGEVNS